MTTYVGTLGEMVRRQRQATHFAWAERMGKYALWDGYYDNTVYQALTDGGYRDEINRMLGGANAADLVGLYNPVRSVVNLYEHVFGGVFGREIVIAPQDAATSALTTAVDNIWKQSNITIRKTSLCRMAARLGCVGIRIVADEAKQRVYLKFEHPRIIRDVELDDRDNVTAIQLEYDITTGLAEDAKTITIREQIDKAQSQTWRMEAGQAVARFDVFAMRDNGPRSVIPNTLGVVPYVLLRHDPDSDDDFGKNAFAHVTDPLDRFNSLASHVGIQVHRTVRSKWLVAASGKAPQEFDLSDMSIVYVDTQGSASTPTVEAMIANLNLADAVGQATFQLGLLEEMLPELKAVQGKYLAGQSGETIAQLRKPARDLLSLARTNYEDALIRAQQIAVSYGVLLGLWNVGTGTGSVEAAERAYTDGYENMVFNERPIFDDEVTNDAATNSPATEETNLQPGDGSTNS